MRFQNKLVQKSNAGCMSVCRCEGKTLVTMNTLLPKWTFSGFRFVGLFIRNPSEEPNSKRAKSEILVSMVFLFHSFSLSSVEAFSHTHRNIRHSHGHKEHSVELKVTKQFTHHLFREMQNVEHECLHVIGNGVSVAGKPIGRQKTSNGVILNLHFAY